MAEAFVRTVSAIKVPVSSPMLATSALASAALRELEEVAIQSSFRLQFLFEGFDCRLPPKRAG
jgi:hypothetical protein